MHPNHILISTFKTLPPANLHTLLWCHVWLLGDITPACNCTYLTPQPPHPHHTSHITHPHTPSHISYTHDAPQRFGRYDKRSKLPQWIQVRSSPWPIIWNHTPSLFKLLEVLTDTCKVPEHLNFLIYGFHSSSAGSQATHHQRWFLANCSVDQLAQPGTALT